MIEEKKIIIVGKRSVESRVYREIHGGSHVVWVESSCDGEVRRHPITIGNTPGCTPSQVFAGVEEVRAQQAAELASHLDIGEAISPHIPLSGTRRNASTKGSEAEANLTAK